MESVPANAKQDSSVEVDLEKRNIEKLYAKMLKAGVNANDLAKLDEYVPVAKVESVPVQKEHYREIEVELKKSNMEKFYAKMRKAGVNENDFNTLDEHVPVAKVESVPAKKGQVNEVKHEKSNIEKLCARW